MKIIQLFALLLMVPTPGFAALDADTPANVSQAAQVLSDVDAHASIDRNLLKHNLKSIARTFAFLSQADSLNVSQLLRTTGYNTDPVEKIFLITSKRKHSKKPVTKRSAWLKKRKAKRRKARVNRNSASFRQKLRRAVIFGVYR